MKQNLREFLETISPDSMIKIHFIDEVYFKGYAGELLGDEDELKHLENYDVIETELFLGVLNIEVV